MTAPSSEPTAKLPTIIGGRGIIDRIFAAVERLPGPPEAWYIGLGVVLAASAELAIWGSGAGDWWAVNPEAVIPALVVGYFLALVSVLNRVARAAFNEFRPALGDPGAEETYLLRLVSMRDRTALLAMALGAVVLQVAYYVFVSPFSAPAPAMRQAVDGILWTLAALVLGLAVYRTVSQLQVVVELHRVARHVDIFKPAPTNAFSRLTAVGPIGLLGFVAAAVLAIEQQGAYVVQEAAGIGIAVASFILPLRVMHDRLAHEKSGHQAAVQDRLKRVLARLHDAVDSNDLTHADQLDKMLSAVLAERDLISRLPTWPWSTTTIRGFASALLLPLVIFVITRVIDRLL